MAELSPQAQAVLDAAHDGANQVIFDIGDDSPVLSCAAAALRAVADQVVPEERKPSADSDYHLMNWRKSLDQYAQRKQTRAELLAIATELENAQ